MKRLLHLLWNLPYFLFMATYYILHILVSLVIILAMLFVGAIVLLFVYTRIIKDDDPLE